MAVIGAEKIAMADEVGGGMSWKRDPKKAVQGGLFFELESTPGTAGNDMSLQPDENLPAFPSFQPVPEPTREPAHSGSFLCSKIREKSPFFGMNPIRRLLEEPLDKQNHIKICKIFAIVERNLVTHYNR